MGQFRIGDIVLVDIPDPNGKQCDNEHPALLFRGPDSAGTIYVLGISSKFTERRKYWIPLDWREGGHPVTGLWKPCVLKCDWRVRCNVKQITKAYGTVDLKTIELAMDYVLSILEDEKARIRNSPPNL